MIKLGYINDKSYIYKIETVTNYVEALHKDALVLAEDFVYDIKSVDIKYVDGIFIPEEREMASERLLLVAKENRQVLVNSIEVEYNGIVYQGDEESQNRMSRAINGLPDDTTTISWKASDNSSQELNRLDLKEILFLAGQEQTRIWFN